MNLSGKVALVTGASSGIGFQVAKTLALAGAKLAVSGRKVENLQYLIQEINAKDGISKAFPADVLEEGQIEKVLDQVNHHFGKLDIVVHCAGMTIKGPLQNMSTSNWDMVLDSNLKSTYFLAKHSWKYLQRTEPGVFSKFLAIGSVGTYLGIPLSAAYCASKGGLVQLVKTLAVEWAKQQINVNAVCPGYIRTPLSDSVLKIGETYKKVISRIPMRCIGSPEDIANAVLFLVSPLSNYITGATLNVDGGLLSAAYTMDD